MNYFFISYLFILFFFYHFYNVELTLPDMVTKITSTPSKSDATKAVKTKLSQQLPMHPPPSSDMNMEFLIPHLPTTTRSGQPQSSSSSRNLATSNGSILQSAINNLNSKNNHLPPPPLMTQHSHTGIPQHHQQHHQHTHLHHHHHTHLIQPSNGTQNKIALPGASAIRSQPQTSAKLISQSAATSPPKITSLSGLSSTRLPAPSQTQLPPPQPATLHPQQHNKMTKKQLKLAQAQLDKLTQINIHLHGTYVFYVFFYILYFSFTILCFSFVFFFEGMGMCV